MPPSPTPAAATTGLDPAALRAAVEHYRRAGYAVLRGVFGAADLAELRTAFDRQWQAGMALPRSFRHGNRFYRLGEDRRLGRILRLVQWASYDDPVLARYRVDPRFVSILEPLLGRDLKQIINQLHWKPPGAAGAEFAYHQDVRFRRPRDAYRDIFHSYVQTGIAIDRHRAANGAMRLYPGSHLLGEVDLSTPGPVLDSAMAEDTLRRAGLDPARLIDLDLDPGDVAFWNVFTIHGSGPNTTQEDRRFYLNGYVRAADCDRGEWAFRDGAPCALGAPVLVHFEELFERPEPHFIDG